MRRSAKISLYAVVLAGVVGGTGAWALTDKSVSLSVDGQARTVHTRAGTVAGALKDAHLKLAEHDVIAPAVSAGIHDGSRVVVRRGRELHLVVDGQGKDVWTTAATVDAALSELGYGPGKVVSVSRAKRLPLTPTAITLLTPKHVTFIADHKKVAVLTTQQTVAAAMAAAHVSVGQNDTVSAPLASAITEGQTVTVKRVRYVVQNSNVKVPFDKKKEADDTRLLGTTIVVQSGKQGLDARIFQFIYVDGKFVGQRLITSAMVNKPVAEITRIGVKVAVVEKAKPVPPTQPRSDNSNTSNSNSKSTSNSSNSSNTSNSGSSNSSNTSDTSSSNTSDTSSSNTGSAKAHASKPPVKTTQPEPTQPTSSGSSQPDPAPAVTGGSPKDIAARLVAAHGWGNNDFNCLVNLWNRESGWNVHALNGSGAYGIPQALPGSKMSSAGPNWQDDAQTQITWGLGYISARYGSPCGAWGHSQSNGWY